MNTRLRRALFFFKSHFKTKLPLGKTELTAYLDELFQMTGLPDRPSFRRAVATMILHLEPTQDRAPRAYFIRSIRKAMAAEVSYSLIQDIKAQEEKLLSEAALKDKEPRDEQPSS